MQKETWKTWVWTMGREDPLEEEMATHSSIFAWRISWTEEPGELQSMGLQKVGNDWVTTTHSLLIVNLEPLTSPWSQQPWEKERQKGTWIIRTCYSHFTLIVSSFIHSLSRTNCAPPMWQTLIFTKETAMNKRKIFVFKKFMQRKVNCPTHSMRPPSL